MMMMRRRRASHMMKGSHRMKEVHVSEVSSGLGGSEHSLAMLVCVKGFSRRWRSGRPDSRRALCRFQKEGKFSLSWRNRQEYSALGTAGHTAGTTAEVLKRTAPLYHEEISQRLRKGWRNEAQEAADQRLREFPGLLRAAAAAFTTRWFRRNGSRLCRTSVRPNG